MKISRLVPALALFLSVFVTPGLHAEPTWQTDYKKAQEEAKTNNKLILLDFTGSDWCGWCIKLNKEVFSKPEFQNYASKNLVLVEVDFPRRKALNLETRKQNEELAGRFGIQGFPTIVVLNSEGKKIGELSYTDGVDPVNLRSDASSLEAKPERFIAALEKLQKG